MPLFWIVHVVDERPSIFIVEATGGETALIKSAIAGFTGPHSEIIKLDAATARKVPKEMIGRALGQKEATELLKRIGA